MDIGGVYNIKARRTGFTLDACKWMMPFVIKGHHIMIMAIIPKEQLAKKYQAIFKSLGADVEYSEVWVDVPKSKMHFDERGLELLYVDHWIEKRFEGYKFILK